MTQIQNAPSVANYQLLNLFISFKASESPCNLLHALIPAFIPLFDTPSIIILGIPTIRSPLLFLTAASVVL